MSAADIVATHEAARAERLLAEAARVGASSPMGAAPVRASAAPEEVSIKDGDLVDWEGEEGSVELLDIDPEDEVHEGADGAESFKSGFAALFDALPQPSAAPIQLSRARRSAPPAVEQPTMGSLANVETLIALSRLGLKKTPADRLEAYLAPLPVEMRERILMVVAEFG